MQFLSKVFTFFAPTPLSCNDTFDTDLPHDPAPTDQDSPIHTTKRKVPSFEQLLSPVLGITGDHEFIKGFRFDLAVPLSEAFQILQSWELPNSGIKEEGQNPMMQAMMGKGPAKPTYTFMTQVAKDSTNPHEAAGLLLVGKFDTEGRVDSILIKKLGGGWNLKLSGNFINSKTEDGALGSDLEYQDSESSSVLRLQHHPMQGLIGTWNFMQRVHRNIMVGFDFTQLFAHKKQYFSYGAKVFLGNQALYASSVQGGSQYHIGYVVPIRKGTTFVSHYKYEPEGGSTTVLGLRQRYETAEITATVSSKYKLTTVVNLKSPFYSLKLCGEADYQREHYTFGYGVSFGPQQ